MRLEGTLTTTTCGRARRPIARNGWSMTLARPAQAAIEWAVNTMGTKCKGHHA